MKTPTHECSTCGLMWVHQHTGEDACPRCTTIAARDAEWAARTRRAREVLLWLSCDGHADGSDHGLCCRARAALAMPKRKPTHGGARKGAGRPRTTGTGAIKPISCKLPEPDRARAEAAARAAGVTLGEFARAAILVELDAPRLYRRRL